MTPAHLDSLKILHNEGDLNPNDGTMAGLHEASLFLSLHGAVDTLAKMVDPEHCRGAYADLEGTRAHVDDLLSELVTRYLVRGRRPDRLDRFIAGTDREGRPTLEDTSCNGPLGVEVFRGTHEEVRDFRNEHIGQRVKFVRAYAVTRAGGRVLPPQMDVTDAYTAWDAITAEETKRRGT